jgi:hypothetical protein
MRDMVADSVVLAGSGRVFSAYLSCARVRRVFVEQRFCGAVSAHCVRDWIARHCIEGREIAA